MFDKNGKPLIKNGEEQKDCFYPMRRSRDEKVNKPYCSKVCCVTAVNQAIETKVSLPMPIFNLYKDLRLFGQDTKIYTRKRSKKCQLYTWPSEASELDGGRVLSKPRIHYLLPIKNSVDLVVLM
jgi:heterodisulfide reductase subunit A